MYGRRLLLLIAVCFGVATFADVPLAVARDANSGVVATEGFHELNKSRKKSKKRKRVARSCTTDFLGCECCQSPGGAASCTGLCLWPQ
jgi:hypothetical protein